MKEAFWGVLIIVLGLFGIVVVNLFQNVTVDNDRIYYLLKESTEAAAFDYRIIDLNDPFPSREPGANWKGKEEIISSTKNQVLAGSIRRFLISLNRSGIKKTREYNDLYKYDTFNLDEMEKSDFIKNNINIVSREK